MVDLNTLIPPGSATTLTEATLINDRGEIAGNGVLADGDQHAFLLIPCDERQPRECEGLHDRSSYSADQRACRTQLGDDEAGQ